MKHERLTAQQLQRPLSFPRFKDGRWQWISDIVTPEEPFAVVWEEQAMPRLAQGAPHPPLRQGEVVLWGWPKDPALLALGHALLDCAPAQQSLHREATVRAMEAQGPDAPPVFFVSIGPALPGAPPQPPVSCRAETLFVAMRDFIEAEGLWDDTGCFHRAGIFDFTQNALLFRAEDIGRHNCVDRLAGWSVLHGVSLSDKALLLSARLTSSLCAKALRAGFRVLVSRSAVTSAAIRMAEEAKATLIGFARTHEGRFTLFADPAGRFHPPVQENG